MSIPRTARAALVPATAAALLALSACGSTNAQVKDLQKQGQALQKQGQRIQANAKKLQAEVKAGTITAAEAAKQLEAQTKTLENNAKKTASSAIDAAKSNGNIPDSAKKALNDAQTQLNTSP